MDVVADTDTCHAVRVRVVMPSKRCGLARTIEDMSSRVSDDVHGRTQLVVKTFGRANEKGLSESRVGLTQFVLRLESCIDVLCPYRVGFWTEHLILCRHQGLS
eukprot:815627-Rhodomonas_salina.1